ncbi:U7 snRNA-associated Sm-like protein LSm11 [Amphibalanus amphitrite]|uniref:U7 snRNA-associated Sm-like protein LSm11 n=1 Tax=Amphibalanus amphitrite TaxID=1232801 RepID=A0A6A4VVV0_AMPAM|nr:U7 snRNA-associated Sm-like protein LSm11 [Amphibalanus amphitrite]
MAEAPVSRPKKQLRSVLTRMEKAIPGPCGRLKWYMDQRVKVKVYTRNFGRVRGVLTGYIVAFDKHWNLCLEDVDEVYQKKVRRKSCFLGDPDDVQLDYQPGPTDPRLRPRGEAPGQRRPVFETGRRHVNQLFVRGDNVVLVAAEDTADAGGDDEVQEVPDGDVREVPDDDVQVVEAQV